MRLLSSPLATRLVLALRQSGPAELTALSGIMETTPSSVQRALAILVDDGIVEARGVGRQRSYRLLEDSKVAEHLEALAEMTTDHRTVLAIVARANPSVEFLALRGDEVVVVFRKHGRTLDRSRAAAVINRVSRQERLSARLLHHGDVRSELEGDSRLRDEVSSADILFGRLDMTFPDRSGHRSANGTFLGHVNPHVRMPSRRVFSSLKRRYGVRTLRIFGSAVRSDFRPDSDIDIAVQLAPGTTRRADVRASLEEELEHYLQRDVDVVLEDTLRPAVRSLVERQSVAV
jgi:predicted nucleotidyltransferase/DNA-binding transcriptional ArsR family regulator